MSSAYGLDLPRTADWRDEADCRRSGRGLNWWFPKGVTTDSDREQAADAKAVCRECPVAMQCARMALELRLDDGIFGGLDTDQRRSLNRRAARDQYTDAELAKEIRAVWAKDARDPIVDAYLARTEPGDDGHVWWRGKKSSYTVAGRVLTPGKIAFEVGYGRRPEGPVRTSCGQRYCMAAEHLSDGRMRWQRDHMAPAA
ncbi:WhiB family transcriptional regulator [Streptomyces sp. P9(2023)]|uniref:WhiB family transcriptional regulator n=1 Tax=Streptomyces sp. P9(2023) TaxID=3064394 RepID=UPI0028F3E38E|nr:WhiB family transcriptional regulator [Streptomyces sp. P9(2023)]MDT9688162.1 WhiB family transcriptional regulator [Streptomyces sp. P9(2023)]